MRGINKVTLLGRLGKDPETQFLESGTALSRFTLATNDRYKDKTGNWVDQTEWHNVVVWRGLAEIAEKYLKKGSLVYIEGKIRTRSWDDKDGTKKYSTEIVADNLIMLDRKEDGGDHGSGGNSGGSYSGGSGGGQNYQQPPSGGSPGGSGSGMAEEPENDLPF
jgi:single-strand DNA-binding protein